MAKYKFNNKAKEFMFLLILSALLLNYNYVPKTPIQETTQQIVLESKKEENLKVQQMALEHQKLEQQKKLSEITQQQRQAIETEKKRIAEEEEKKKREAEVQWFDIRVSYYTASIENCGNANGITASGKKAQYGMIAAPQGISFGSQIYIEGLSGTFSVEDRGGAITWDGGVMKVDVFIPNASQQQLLNMGVKYTRGYIIKNNN